MEAEDEFEKQLSTLRPHFWQYRVIGRSLGFLLVLGGVGGGSAASWLIKPSHTFTKVFAVGGKQTIVSTSPVSIGGEFCDGSLDDVTEDLLERPKGPEGKT